MLVKDEKKYCWVDDEVAGEPQDSIIVQETETYRIADYV